MCNNEPAECKNPAVFTVNDCSFNQMPFYCPVLCGKCQTTTTTTTPAVTPKACATLTCKNGGNFNSVTCLCECND